jgi:UMP-CMP kinase
MCDKLVKDWDFVHLSAGDLLRAEQAREESQYGALIKKFIQEGEIVPMEITVGLLQNAMQENIRKDRRKFLIDGFPRKMDQATAFESNVTESRGSLLMKQVCESKIVLYLECPEEVMLKRLKGRGRSDDNDETIRKRFRVNQRDAEPVVEYFDKSKKLIRVNCNDTPDGTVLSLNHPNNRRLRANPRQNSSHHRRMGEIGITRDSFRQPFFNSRYYSRNYL